LSISDAADSDAAKTDFDRWIVEEFDGRGEFTALVVLVDIGETKVTPLCTTYFNVIGTEIDWAEITVLFAGSGQDWSGASFYAVTGSDGRPLDNPTARLKLRELEARLDENRLVLNEGRFFDKWGRRLKIEEMQVQ
jgi:hypothetical protein